MYFEMMPDQEPTLSKSDRQSSDKTTENAGQTSKQTTHLVAVGQSFKHMAPGRALAAEK